METRIMLFYREFPEDLDIFLCGENDISLHKDGIKIYDSLSLPRATITIKRKPKQSKNPKVLELLNLLKQLKLQGNIIDYKKL